MNELQNQYKSLDEITLLKKNGEKIGQLNILENNGTKDKLIKGRKNFISKLNTRNQDGDLKKEYYSERNSPRKKEINIFSNNEKN